MKYFLSIIILFLITFINCDTTSSNNSNTNIIGSKPIISLSGSIIDTLTLGESFIEAGYTASDDEDGNITNTVEIEYYHSNKSSTVLAASFTNKAGTYYVKYSVTDTDGNNTIVWRTIIVTNDSNGVNINPDDSSNKTEVLSLQGVWYRVATYGLEISNGDTSVSFSVYDSSFDKLHNAEFIEVSGNNIKYYCQRLFEIDDIEIIELSGFSLITNSASWSSYTKEYIYMQNGYLVKGVIYDESDGYEDEREYWKKYEGAFPISTWQTGLLRDEFEPDNDTANANPINLNETTPVHSISKDDVDCFAFLGSSGKKYLINIYSEESFYLEMLSDYSSYSKGELEWSVKDSLDIKGSAYVIECHKSGEFIFAIPEPDGGSEPSEEGYYTITIFETEFNYE